jgi:hypothetical protein
MQTNQTSSTTATAPTTAGKRTYTLGVTRPAPSMSRDYHAIRVSTYAEAVQEAHDLWKLRRETVTLHSGTDTTYWYHYISADGKAEDRNGNSGVAQFQTLAA